MMDFSLAGRYTELMLRGNLFQYRVPEPGVLAGAPRRATSPRSSNPASSNRVFVPVCISVGFISGTTVIGSVLLAETLNAAVGTGATIPTATLVPGLPCYRGSPVGLSVMQFSPTTNTFTAAPTVFAPTEDQLRCCGSDAELRSGQRTSGSMAGLGFSTPGTWRYRWSTRSRPRPPFSGRRSTASNCRSRSFTESPPASNSCTTPQGRRETPCKCSRHDAGGERESTGSLFGFRSFLPEGRDGRATWVPGPALSAGGE